VAAGGAGRVGVGLEDYRETACALSAIGLRLNLKGLDEAENAQGSLRHGISGHNGRISGGTRLSDQSG